jgi:hypothetical protein
MNEPVFGKAALEKLSSPEQLDQLLQVTSPRDWLAVATFVGLLAALGLWMLMGTMPTTIDGPAILMRQGTVHRVLAEQSGMLKQFLVNYGSHVAAGQAVARVQPVPSSDTSSASGSDIQDVKSLYAGVVVKKAAEEGDLVSTGATLLVLEPEDPTLQVIVYMPLLQGKAVRPGMSVQVCPSTAPREVYGFLVGKVRRVSEFPALETGMLDTLGDEELVKYFLGTTTQAIPLEILVSLVPDGSTPSGYEWSSSKGPPRELSAETLCTASIVLSSQHPITMLLPDTSQ